MIDSDVILLWMSLMLVLLNVTGVGEVRSKETVIYEGFIRKKNSSNVVSKAMDTLNIKCKGCHSIFISVIMPQVPVSSCCVGSMTNFNLQFGVKFRTSS